MILAALSPRIMQAPSALSPHHRRAPAGHGSPRRLAAGLHSGGVGAVGVLTGKPRLGAGSRPSADGAPQQVLCGGLPSGLWPCPLGSGWLCSEGQGAGPGTGRPCPRLHDQSGRVGLRDDAPPPREACPERRARCLCSRWLPRPVADTAQSPSTVPTSTESLRRSSTLSFLVQQRSIQST